VAQPAHSVTPLTCSTRARGEHTTLYYARAARSMLLGLRLCCGRSSQSLQRRSAVWYVTVWIAEYSR
jgi:hypothetical protein